MKELRELIFKNYKIESIEEDFFAEGIDIRINGSANSDEWEITAEYEDEEVFSNIIVLRELKKVQLDCDCEFSFDDGTCFHLFNLFQVICNLSSKTFNPPKEISKIILANFDEIEVPKNLYKRSDNNKDWKNIFDLRRLNNKNNFEGRDLKDPVISKIKNSAKKKRYYCNLNLNRGELVLELMQQNILKNGGFGAECNESWTRLTYENKAYVDPVFLPIIEKYNHLFQDDDLDGYYSWRGRSSSVPEIKLNGTNLEILSDLSRIKRLYYKKELVQSKLEKPLDIYFELSSKKTKKDEAQKFKLNIYLKESKSDKADSDKDQLTINFSKIKKIYSLNIFLDNGILYRFSVLENFSLDDLEDIKNLEIEEGQVEEFLSLYLEAKGSFKNLTLPSYLEEKYGKQVENTLKPKLVAQFFYSRSGEVVSEDSLILKFLFDYNGLRFTLQDAREVIEYEAKKYLARDLNLEKILYDKILKKLNLVSYYNEDNFELPEGSLKLSLVNDDIFAIEFIDFINSIKLLNDENCIIELEKTPIRHGSFSSASITSSGEDWFDLNIDVSFDDFNLSMLDLLKSSQGKSSFLKLPDGSFGILSEKWLKKIQALSAITVKKDGKIRFDSSQAFIIDSWISEIENIDLDQKFKEYSDKVKNFNSIKELSEPSEFNGKLRDYQKFGLGWLNFLNQTSFGGCLADDMGLGKTIQVLALLATQKENLKPNLIVAPNSLIENWQNESVKFTKNVKVDLYHGSERKLLFTLNKKKVLVLCTTYGTLVKDIEQFKEVDFNYIILDEAQKIKNATSLVNKSVRLLKAENRLALTGTPIENSMHDLFSIFEFLNPSFRAIASSSRKALKLTEDPKEVSDLKSFLLDSIKPFLLRRTKEEVLKELPLKTEKIIHCEMTAKQKKAYEDMRNAYKISLTKEFQENGFNKSKMNVLTALLRLRQIACHPALVDPKYKYHESGKLNFLLEELEELYNRGHKVLVFSQFIEYLNLVKEKLISKNFKFNYLDGQTTKRQKLVDQFQEASGGRIFLISIKAGGCGLNLTAADYCFIIDPWWNPAVEKQAIDRIHRIGQKKPVFSYKLVTKGSVEEKILNLQASKQKLADALVNCDESFLKALDAEQFEELLAV